MFNFKLCITGLILINCVLNVFGVENEEIDAIAKDKIRIAFDDLQNRSALESREIRTTWSAGLQKFDSRYSTLPQLCGNYTLPKDCAEATSCTNRSGIYMIENYNSDPYYVECDEDSLDGDWLVIQRRQDGSVDFERDWVEYEQGFGNIDGEFWIGLKKLYALTNFNGPQELLLIMDTYNLTSAYAKYDNFSIGEAHEYYYLKSIGQYSGTAGNYLQQHLNLKFSTRDRDFETTNNYSSGGWWRRNCHYSNFNGKYGQSNVCTLFWWGVRSSENLKNVKMMIRRRQN